MNIKPELRLLEATRSARLWVQQSSRFTIPGIIIVFIFATLSLGTSQNAYSQLPDGWQTNWANANELARENNLPMFVVFSAKWCSPCQKMLKQVFPVEEVQKELKNWIPVYLDIEKEENQEIVKKYRATQLPTMIYLEPNGNEIDRTVGGISTAKRLVELLEGRGHLEVRLPDAKLLQQIEQTQQWTSKQLGDKSAAERLTFLLATMVAHKEMDDYEAFCIVYSECAINEAKYGHAATGMSHYMKTFPEGAYFDKYQQLLPQINEFRILSAEVKSK